MGIIRNLVISGTLLSSLPLFGQLQSDPILTAAVIEQTVELKEQYKKRRNAQEAIAALQLTVTGAMKEVHDVETKILKYMGNASAAVQNMYQIKQIGELVAIEIPNNLIELGKDIPDNIKGTAITLLVNKTVQDTTADIIALSDIVSRLVTSKYVFDEKTDPDSKNLNLLSAAERFAILHDVHYRLNNINKRLWLTKYYIKSFSWRHLWMGLDRESWCNIVYGKMLSNQIINQWNQLIKN